MREIRLGSKTKELGAVVLGYFDCVHIGHSALISEAKTADACFCFTFSSDISKLLPTKSPSLYSYEERKARFVEQGVDGVIYSPFDEQIMAMSPKGFLDELFNTVEVKKIVCGRDYRFGKMGAGDTAYLEDYCRQRNVPIALVEDVLFEGEKASTTLVKRLLKEGKLSRANALLGGNYFKYCQAKQVGETLELTPVSGDFGLKEGTYEVEVEGRQTIVKVVRLCGKRLPCVKGTGSAIAETEGLLNNISPSVAELTSAPPPSSDGGNDVAIAFAEEPASKELSVVLVKFTKEVEIC